ncbi:MAG: tetratricopeptide repeat protein [Saprospiraceae bacterium]
MKRRIHFIGLTLALLFFNACVTQKSKSDVSPVGKLYHNTTAKYNGYFNANEIMTATLLAIEQKHQDNYLERLPLFPYLELQNPKEITPDMDKVIEKVTRVVALHEKSYWTDDCYLMVGKAQFLKQDYEAAEETLRFAADEFNPNRPKGKPSKRANLLGNTAKSKAQELAEKIKARNEAKKDREKANKEKAREREKAAKEKAKQRKLYNKQVKRAKKRGLPAPKRPAPGAPPAKDPKQLEQEAKKKAKEEEAKQKEEAKAQGPDTYFLKHRPAYYETVLWLARTLVERGNEDTALRMLEKLLEDPKLFTEVRNEAWLLLAHLHLKREETDEAIPPLENVVEATTNRKSKARYAFVLAQLHQESANWQKAADAYQIVVQSTDSYIMAFRAKLSLALINYTNQSANAPEVAQQLEKLLKDPKNTEYKDQIHFTLANIALAGNDRAKAVEQFNLAVQASVNNALLKGEAYYSLANLYLEDEDYVPAKLYLDSTLNTLSNKDKRFNTIAKTRDGLTDIAAYLTTIADQDSLLKISYLSDEEKRALASQIKKAEDERRLAELAAKQANQPALSASSREDLGAPQLGQANLESAFFAYNERNLKRGERDFQEKWGNRPLADNWRRTSQPNDAAQPLSETQPNTETKSGKSSLLLSPEEIDQIFANVPKTDADRRAAEFKIAEAMFKLGGLFRERIENYPRAIDILEKLQTRFPKNNYELDTWFNLYLSYKSLKDQANTDKYAKLILDKYGSSKYAQIIRDPNVKDIFNQRILQINAFYDAAYGAFNTGDYQKARDLCLESRLQFGVDNPLFARFALLHALCIGKLEGKEAYVQALTEFIAKFPNTNEEKQAREMLRIIGGPNAALPGGQNTNTAETGAGFTREDDQMHYILIVGTADMDVNTAKISISDYNKKYHKLEKLNLTNMFLGSEETSRVPLIIVRRFDNRIQAMKYYEGALANQSEFVSSGNFEVLAISLNNYRELIRQQSVEAYKKFFAENY